MKNILKSKKGESIVELLVAILIMGMSAMLMGGLITTSIKLNTQAENGDVALYTEINAAETKSIILDSQETTITITTEDNVSISIPVAVYGKEEDALVAFGKKEVSGG